MVVEIMRQQFLESDLELRQVALHAVLVSLSCPFFHFVAFP